MSFGNHQQAPFWDFVRYMDNTGAGVDGPAFNYGAAEAARGPGTNFFAGGWGGPFGFHHEPHGHHGHHGWGRGGCRRGGPPGGHCRRPRDPEKDPKDPEKDPKNPEDPESPEDPPRYPGEGDHSNNDNSEGPSWGPWARRHWGGRRGGRGPWGRHHHRGGEPPFDMSAMMAAMANHPIAQAIRNFATDVQGTRGPEAAAEDEHTFTPPIDIFTTTDGYVLHIALPGAKKEDVGVNWDADKNELSVAGVVYRPGDEAFLANLTRGERRVGMFERSVRLPPVGVPSEEKEEVDAENITARMEDGVLIVTVPKVEREWTEVRKVDIE